jgi:AraC family transcriptional regulator of arabinose operon
MQAHPGQVVSVSHLAGEAGLSPSRFAHLFRAETGSTPARMFLRMRVMHAAELLTATPPHLDAPFGHGMESQL